MKRVSLPSLANALICLIAAPLCTKAISPDSLLPDGGFEQGLKHWASFINADAAGKGCKISTTSESPYEGRQTLRLDSDQPARYGVMPASGPIEVEPGERYRVSAQVRADKGARLGQDSPGPLIRLTLLKPDGSDAHGGHFIVGLDRWLGRNRFAYPAPEELPQEWTEISATIDVPPGVGKIVPTFFAWNTQGTLYVDAFTFEKVTAETAATGIDDLSREVFDALDLDFPEAQPIREMLASGNLPAARQALLEYYRKREAAVWPQAIFNPSQPDTRTPYNKERADNAAQGRVTGGHVRIWKTFPENRIDWLHNETRELALSGQNVPFNLEWQWQLTRMNFWNDLAAAYRATADERYAQAWVQQMRSFAEQCPAPDTPNNGENNLPDSAWRSLEAGIRMHESWPNAWQSFIRSPSVSPEDMILFLHSSLQHGRYLSFAYSKWGNWLTSEMNGLYTVGTLFPEFKEAGSWRAFAIAELMKDFNRQFPPDGMHFEYSPGYHDLAVRNIAALPKLANLSGRSKELPSDYTAALQNAFDALLYLMTPQRGQPKTNDSWDLDTRVPLALALEFFPEREDYQWVVSDGQSGHPPEHTSHLFDYSGHAVMRSGWETDANMLLFDAGPLGYAHQHQDKLNLILYAWGREILFDNGGGSYEQSKWRSWSLGSKSHNTVLVDGLGQDRPRDRNYHGEVGRSPLDLSWQSTPLHDYARGTYNEGYGSTDKRIATHIRRVYFQKPDVFIVADTLIPNDENAHSYQALWHLISPHTRTDPVTQSVTTSDREQPNLAVIPLLTNGLDVRAVSAQTEPELMGWNVRKDSTRQADPATTVIHTRNGKGTQTFLTLLLPLRSGTDTGSSQLESIQPVAGTPDTLTLRLKDGRTFNISNSSDPDAELKIMTVQP